MKPVVSRKRIENTTILSPHLPLAPSQSRVDRATSRRQALIDGLASLFGDNDQSYDPSTVDTKSLLAQAREAAASARDAFSLASSSLQVRRR